MEFTLFEVVVYYTYNSMSAIVRHGDHIQFRNSRGMTSVTVARGGQQSPCETIVFIVPIKRAQRGSDGYDVSLCGEQVPFRIRVDWMMNVEELYKTLL